MPALKFKLLTLRSITGDPAQDQQQVAYTNLNYLKSITDDDPEILREMIGLFLLQVPDYIVNMNKYYREGQYDLLSREAHKAKSSLDIVGMTDLGKEMKVLQLIILEGGDVKECLPYITIFEEQCKSAVLELQSELNTL